MTPLEKALREAVEAVEKAGKVVDKEPSPATMIIAEDALARCMNLVHDHADELLALVEGWVPVSERLPEMQQLVLVRGWGEKRKHYIFSLAYRKRVSANRMDWMDDDHETLWFEVVDWQPLPAPPQEET